MTQDQVMHAFLRGDNHATASNMFIQDNALFSRYQAFEPFPLARRIRGIDGHYTVLTNGDNPTGGRWARRGGWGRSGSGNWVTQEHQQKTFNVPGYREAPRVAFSCFGPDMANINPSAMQYNNHVTDETGTWRAVKDTNGNWKRNESGQLLDHDDDTVDGAIPVGAARRPVAAIRAGTNDGNATSLLYVNDPVKIEHELRGKEVSEVRWHRMGTVVLRNSADGSDLICSMDENNYFVSKLPTQVESVSEAFEALKPIEVVEWEGKNGAAKRQGEWFFCKVSETSELLVPINEIQTPYDLPHNEESNIHRCEQGFTHAERTERDESAPLVESRNARGRVEHYTPEGRRSGEHADLVLGSSFHVTHKNTSLGDWTIPGNGARGPMVD
jgi:hypothetical protein